LRRRCRSFVSSGHSPKQENMIFENKRFRLVCWAELLPDAWRMIISTRENVLRESNKCKEFFNREKFIFAIQVHLLWNEMTWNETDSLSLHMISKFQQQFIQGLNYYNKRLLAIGLNQCVLQWKLCCIILFNEADLHYVLCSWLISGKRLPPTQRYPLVSIQKSKFHSIF